MTFLRLIIGLSDYFAGVGGDIMVHTNSYLCKSEIQNNILVLSILSDPTRPKVPLEITKVIPGDETPNPFLNGFIDVVNCDLDNGHGLRHYALFVPKKQLVRLH